MYIIAYADNIQISPLPISEVFMSLPSPLTMIHTPEQLGAILRDQRRARKLSQGQVATRLDISQSWFSELEQNPAEINLARLLVLAKTLGLEVMIRSQDASPGSTPSEDW
ncbi:MAG: helix-turn-helix domain-containing protein [Rhodocyclales bacterium]|nr:helix-turn-helix domain-containing protein [Rhodocyclales bacterium]